MKKKSKRTLLSPIIICAVIIGAWLLANSTNPASDHAAPAATTGSYGNLLDVRTSDACKSEFKKQYPGMDISYNSEWHQPNWVAWELTRQETTGPVGRENKFYCDDSVPGCADHYDYSYSGYDRGHMAPAGDMKWSKEAMHGSFSMANICPQAKALNTGAWKTLEEKCRTWAAADSAIIIICGPVMTDQPYDHIGDSRVAVPRRFFKVILSPHVTPMRGIGFIMPNDKVPGGIQAAATTIDEVERITGHDFFASLPDDIETEVESQCDFPYWSKHK